MTAPIHLAEIPGGRWRRIRDIVASCEHDTRPLTLAEFGQVLRDARALTGLSLGDLSDMLKTTATALSNVERGQTARSTVEDRVRRRTP